MTTMTLSLDDADYAAIQEAIAHRQTWRCVPASESCTAGRIIAEICRGWLDGGGEPPDEAEAWKE